MMSYHYVEMVQTAQTLQMPMDCVIDDCPNLCCWEEQSQIMLVCAVHYSSLVKVWLLANYFLTL